MSVSRLAPGDLVKVFLIFNESSMDWDECDKVGLVLSVNDHEDGSKVFRPDETFVTMMLDGQVYEHEYYESDLKKIQRG